MADFAYTSYRRLTEEKVFAVDCVHDDWRYYCPNKMCGAHLSIVRAKGSDNPYYYVKRGNESHVDRCPYYYKNGRVTNWDTHNCNADDLFGPMETDNQKINRNIRNNNGHQDNGGSHQRKLSTITALYDYCIQYGCDTYVPGFGTNIGEYVCCSENAGFDSIEGRKIVEIRYGRNANADLIKDIAYYPYWNNDDNRIVIDIDYASQELFDYFSELFKNHPNDLFIVAGNFHRNLDRRSSVLIRRRSQIHHFSS